MAKRRLSGKRYFLSLGMQMGMASRPYFLAYTDALSWPDWARRAYRIGRLAEPVANLTKGRGNG